MDIFKTALIQLKREGLLNNKKELSLMLLYVRYFKVSPRCV